MDIINLIVDGSKKESDLDALKKMLDQNLDKIKSNANHFTTALNNLDSEKHALGLIYLLFVSHLFLFSDNFFIVCKLDLPKRLMHPKLIPLF